MEVIITFQIRAHAAAAGVAKTTHPPPHDLPSAQSQNGPQCRVIYVFYVNSKIEVMIKVHLGRPVSNYPPLMTPHPPTAKISPQCRVMYVVYVISKIELIIKFQIRGLAAARGVAMTPRGVSASGGRPGRIY